MTSKNKIILFDTNVILRYLLEDNQDLHLTAKLVLDLVQIGEKRAIILESVFTEVIFVLLKVYTIPRSTIEKTIRGLLHYKGIVNNDKAELIKALSLFATTNLHIVDCILYVKANSQDRELITFDTQLSKLTL